MGRTLQWHRHFIDGWNRNIWTMRQMALMLWSISGWRKVNISVKTRSWWEQVSGGPIVGECLSRSWGHTIRHCFSLSLGIFSKHWNVAFFFQNAAENCIRQYSCFGCLQMIQLLPDTCIKIFLVKSWTIICDKWYHWFHITPRKYSNLNIGSLPVNSSELVDEINREQSTLLYVEQINLKGHRSWWDKWVNFSFLEDKELKEATDISILKSELNRKTWSLHSA